ncbi:MAG TPA: ATP-binding protein [Methylomirabilota bacterium]
MALRPWAASLGLAVVVVVLLAMPAAAEEPRRVNVLLLYTEPRLGPAIVAVDEAFRSTLESRRGGGVYFYTEFLDLSLFDGSLPRRELRDLLIRKYAGRRLDLVLAVSSRGLRIAVENRDTLFPGTPIVFVAVDPAAAADVGGEPNLTGTWLKIGWSSTLDIAMRLQPTARRVVVITGSGAPDRVWLAAARTQLAPYRDRVELTYLSDLRFADALARVAQLSPDTVLLIGAFTRDADNHDFVAATAAAEIARAASVPAYSFSEPIIGNGAVGGDVVDFRSHGIRAAELAARVLDGERPAPTAEGTNALVFDWRQLRRWSMDERRLPPGSIVRFHETSVWDDYKRYIVGTAAVLLLQTGLITGLVVNRAQRRRAQAALAERLRFETLLTELSAVFATLGPDQVDAAIEHGLRRIVVALDLDRAALFALRGDDRVEVSHAWTREGISPRPATVGVAQFPWIVARLRRGETVDITAAAELPDEASTDRAYLAELGVRSLLAVPFAVGGVGWAVGFSTVRAERAWPAELAQRLRLVTEVFANALERRHAEHAMRESEDRFRVLAESVPLMIWMSSSTGRRTYFNDRWLQATGCRLEDALDDGWLACVHPDDRQETLKAIRWAVEGHAPFTVEYRLRRPDGEDRWVIDHGVPRRSADGTVVGYIGSGVDVTELRRVQLALLESNALRSAIFGSVYGHVAAVDRAGTIIAANDGWRRLAEANGVDPEAVSVGASYFHVCQRVSGMTESDARRARAVVTGVVAGDRERAQLEYSTRTGEGVRWFDLSVEALRRAEGGAVISHVETTRRRHAEDEARRQREALAHALRVTTLGELAASLAHEINQPLSAIVTNAQATGRLLDAGSAATDDIRAALRDIAADGTRASKIIHRLRALFSKEQLPGRTVDVNELVVETLSLVEYDLRRRGIDIRSIHAPALPPVSMDQVQIQQVVLNLLVNAIEAVVAAGAGPRLITVTTIARGDDRVEICVADTGVGATSPDLERMFEPFVTTKINGLGMGLAISRSIVRAHEGKIWATANADRGITVHVELPIERSSGA